MGVRFSHFCPVDMKTRLRSFRALGWCLDDGDLGRGWGAVAIWGFAEQNKQNSYYSILGFFLL